MPQPVFSDVHISSALTNIATAYTQDEDAYVADKVFPIVPVSHQTDQYFKWNKGDWFRDEARQRADATESAGTGFNLATGAYYAREWALHKDVGAQVRNNADPAVDIDVTTTRFLMQRMLISRERAFVGAYMNTGMWGTDIVGAATPGAGQTYFWDDDANSDPFTDISNAQAKMLQTTGQLPNRLTLSYPVYLALRKHPLVIDRIKYTNPAYAGTITPQLLAAAFDVERVIVSKAVYNAAAEGLADSMSFVMGKSVLLSYAPDAPGLMEPSAGYIFAWSGLAPTYNNLGTAVYQIPMPWLGRDTIRTEASMAFDMNMVGSDLGYYFSNIIAN